MDEDDLDGIVAFLRAAGTLKDTLRTGRTASGRTESTAEHTWRLCLMALLLERALDGLDTARLMKLCIVHDLGEAVSGDIPAPAQADRPDKAAQERADLEALCAPLPAAQRAEILALWAEYDACTTQEAVIAKGLDKLETLFQHVEGANPPGFDYAYNLDYGTAQTAAHPLLAALRARADAATRARLG